MHFSQVNLATAILSLAAFAAALPQAPPAALGGHCTVQDGAAGFCTPDGQTTIYGCNQGQKCLTTGDACVVAFVANQNAPGGYAQDVQCNPYTV